MTDPTPVRPASTVVIARAADIEPEIFMVRRHTESAFGAAHAFPGGVIEPDDARVHEYCRGLTEADANVRLGVSRGGLDYYSAAVRELFEESGVLLADVSRLDEHLAAVRDALNDGSQSWADFVCRNQLDLYCDQLYYISHWITPDLEPKRYSTRFFVTALPPDQTAAHCGGELTDSCWTTAPDMLARSRNGEVKLIFPTVKTLESIARHKSLPSLLDWAKSSVDWGITSVIPMTITRNGKREIVLPGDRDYPGSRI